MMILALTLGFQSAHAVSSQNVTSVVVHFADLDLSRSEGVAALYRRLKGAAKTLCEPLNARDLEMQMNFRTCLQSALSAAVANIDRLALTAYHEAQTNSRHETIQIAQQQNR